MFCCGVVSQYVGVHVIRQQAAKKLVVRVDVAKADTEAALNRIDSNTAELDDALNTLKGKQTV